MFRLFSTPDWFATWDLLFSSIGFVIALLIAAYSYRLYRIHKDENKFAYFSFAFVLVAVSLAAKMITGSVLAYQPLRDVTAVVLKPLAGPSLQFSNLLYRAVFFVEMVCMLGAWLLIFFISQKSRDRLHTFHELTQIGLFIYLVFLISIISNFRSEVFYLTSTVLLSLIVLNYYKNYNDKQRNRNAWRVMVSFLLIFVGNLILIPVFLVPGLYVAGEVLILLGFLSLLYTYHSVTQR
ncbi:hypothetical protein HYV86_04215 [Candidatus Woesearchaeota archaeon]|nr:hypothetical protein [Candidatus Woesearchaeota archaeon]